MSGRKAVAWAGLGFAGLFAAASLPLIVANRDTPMQSYFGTPTLEVAFVILMLLSLPTVGAVVASRRPENPVGWILLVAGLSFAFSIFANEWAVFALITAPGALPAGVFMVWATSTWAWIPAFGLLAVL